MTDWTFLSYHLATWGIASDITEVETDDYEEDPWLPRANSDAVSMVLDLEGANKLAEILEAAFERGRA